MITLLWEIFAESLSWLEGTQNLLLGKVPFHQAISYTIKEGRELHLLSPNTVKLVRKDRKNIWNRTKRSDGVYLHSSEIREHTFEWES